MEYANLLTASQIADRLDEQPQRVAYAIRKHRLKPVERVGIIRLFRARSRRRQSNRIYTAFRLGERTVISSSAKIAALSRSATLRTSVSVRGTWPTSTNGESWVGPVNPNRPVNLRECGIMDVILK